jgi:hypothetical protein
MVTKPTGKPSGRPSSYREDMPKRAYRLCLLGLTDEELGISFGVVEETINAWKREHEEFSASIERGREAADGNVGERLYMRALGYSHKAVKIFLRPGDDKPTYAEYIQHYPPDTAAASLWLRNRQGKRWRDKQEVEHSGQIGLAEMVINSMKEREGK